MTEPRLVTERLVLRRPGDGDLDAYARVLGEDEAENVVSARVAERIGMHHAADGLTRSGDPMLIYRLPAGGA